MATTPSSSPLSNLMQRRQQVQRTRDILGLSGGGAPQGNLRAGKPINSNEPGSPTPDQPAQTVPSPASTPSPTGPASTPAGAAGMNPDEIQPPQTPEDRTKLVEQFLDLAKTHGKPVVPAPAIAEPPPSTAPALADQIAAQGAENMSPEMQFIRIAGRTPSGRDMAMFYATSALAQQLGRNPTPTELLQYMTQQGGQVQTGGPAVLPGVNS